MDNENKYVPMSCDDFMALELLRLVSSINRVAPESRDYAQLLENIERFGATCTMLPDIWKIFSKYYESQGIVFDDSQIPKEAEPEIVEFKPKVPVEVEAEQAQTSEENKTEKAEDEPKQESNDATEYDAAEVKKALAKARADGKLPKIKEWLVQNFGVEGFSALPASRYGEVVDKLKEMGVAV